MLEHPIIAAIIAGLILVGLVSVGTWLFRRVFRPEIRVVTVIERGPTSQELGFTESAVKITLQNISARKIQIKDIRLIFCGDYGAPVAPEAPTGRSHRELPVSLASGTDDHWYIPAEKFSDLLRSLYRPSKETGTGVGKTTVYARCVTGNHRIYKSPSFPIPLDPDSHWS